MYEIRPCDLTPRPTAVVRATMPPDTVVRWLPGAYRRVARALADQGVPASGPPFARYTANGDLVDVEAGVPAAIAIVSDGTVVASGLPGGPAVVATHVGGYELLDAAYRDIEEWLRLYGYTEAGPHWESYVTDQRTDIVVPYRPAPVYALL